MGFLGYLLRLGGECSVAPPPDIPSIGGGGLTGRGGPGREMAPKGLSRGGLKWPIQRDTRCASMVQ